MDPDNPSWGRTIEDLRTLDEEDGRPPGEERDRRELPRWLTMHPRTTTLADMGRNRKR